MKLICQQCTGEFEGVRVTAKFCSDRCNKRNQRGMKEVTRTEVSGTNLTGTVSGTTEKRVNGTKEWLETPGDGTVWRNCKGCTEEQTKWCLCYKCVAEKRNHKTLNLICCPTAGSMV